MSASTAVYVCLRGEAMRVGRLAAARKGVRRWRSAVGLEPLPPDAVQLPLMSRSAQDAEAVVARLDQLVSIEQLRGAVTEEQNPIGCTAVAQRVLSAAGPEQRAAVVIAILRSQQEFVLEGHQIRRTTEAERHALMQAVEERRSAEEGVTELAKLRTELATFGAVQTTPSASLLGHLKALAHCRAAADPSWVVALGARDSTQTAMSEGAARALADLGVWDGHEDLPLVRSGLLNPWPSLQPPPRLHTPTSRLSLPFITLDNDNPDEVDDALWAEFDGDDVVVTVAIASPTDWIALGDQIDRGARARVATLYHPRHVAPMLPEAVIAVSSLDAGLWRPALVTRFRVQAQGPQLEEISYAEIRVEEAWSYDQAQRAIDEERAPQWLSALQVATDRCERRRISDGAYLLYRDDVEVRAKPHQLASIARAPQSQPTRRLVAEAMVQACALIGRRCHGEGVLLPYRIQQIRPNPALPPGLYTEPADIQTMLGHLGPAKTQTSAGRHDILGVDAYVQMTSPLRRYGDLVAHYQILAWLRGERPPLDSSALMGALAHVKGVVRSQRAHVSRSRRYFQLLALAREGLGRTIRAQIVREAVGGGRNVAFDPERVLEVELPGYLGPVGAWVELEVVEVDATAGRVVVKPAAQSG